MLLLKIRYIKQLFVNAVTLYLFNSSIMIYVVQNCSSLYRIIDVHSCKFFLKHYYIVMKAISKHNS